MPRVPLLRLLAVLMLAAATWVGGRVRIAGVVGSRGGNAPDPTPLSTVTSPPVWTVEPSLNPHSVLRPVPSGEPPPTAQITYVIAAAPGDPSSQSTDAFSAEVVPAGSTTDQSTGRIVPVSLQIPQAPTAAPPLTARFSGRIEPISPPR